MPNPKDDITEVTAVRHMINQTSQGGVKQTNKTVSISKAPYNDLAEQAGFTLDWTTAPKITGMKIGDARKTMNEWMFNEMDKAVPELGLKTRRESLRSQQKRAEEELGLTNEKPAEVNRPISPALQALLDSMKAKKGKPPGVMEMMTGNNPLTKEDIFVGRLKQNFDDLPTGSFTENGVRHEIVDNASYTNMPDEVKKLVPDMPKKLYRQIDVKTGKVIEGAKSMADLQAEVEQMLKQSREGKKKGK